jgi:hypothetical protein
VVNPLLGWLTWMLVTPARQVMIPVCEQSPGREPANDGGSFQGPVLLQLHCATQGASMGYTFEPGENATWHLYTTPVELPKGTATVRCKAIRIGYAESPETAATFEID